MDEEEEYILRELNKTWTWTLHKWKSSRTKVVASIKANVVSFLRSSVTLLVTPNLGKRSK